jgi:hypothetical protein
MPLECKVRLSSCLSLQGLSRCPRFSFWLFCRFCSSLRKHVPPSNSPIHQFTNSPTHQHQFTSELVNRLTNSPTGVGESRCCPLQLVRTLNAPINSPIHQLTNSPIHQLTWLTHLRQIHQFTSSPTRQHTNTNSPTHSPIHQLTLVSW